MHSLVIEPYGDEDALIAAVQRDRRPGMSIYRPTGISVVLGRGSKVALELRVDACVRDRVRLQRRRGGGCAVVLDPGNVIISIVLPTAGIGDSPRYFDTMSSFIIAGLDAIGFAELSRAGISDLALDDHKVGGSCMHRERAFLHYSTTLLIRPRIDLMERYLKHPPREPEYRRGRPHREFVSSLVTNPESSETDRMVAELERVLDTAVLCAI